MFKKGNQICKGRIPWNKGKKGIHLSPKSEFKKGDIPWNKGTKGIMIKSKTAYCFPKGKKHPRWKGGQYKAQGYIFILKPNHPFANKQGYVMEHRLVMEQKLKRYLKPIERSHHINGIRDDNRPINLMYFPNESEHQKFHYLNNLPSPYNLLRKGHGKAKVVPE